MALPSTNEVTCADGRVLRFCRYGPVDGIPVISHSGSPSSRWKRPDQIEAMEQSGLCLLVYDRPGYGGSTRRPGRTVADVVQDVRILADAHGWPQFAVFGGSGGGPHALACAALLADRVTWGFEPGSIRVPVGIWRGTADAIVPAAHSEWLLTHIKTAQGYVYAGGHLPDTDVYSQIYAWLRDGSVRSGDGRGAGGGGGGGDRG